VFFGQSLGGFWGVQFAHPKLPPFPSALRLLRPGITPTEKPAELIRHLGGFFRQGLGGVSFVQIAQSFSLYRASLRHC